jgi:uncharacterized protein YuzE
MKKIVHGFMILYDEFTDTLYISKDKPKKASSFIDENYILVRKTDNGILGVTIDGFKRRRKEEKSWSDDFILKYLPKFHILDLQTI